MAYRIRCPLVLSLAEGDDHDFAELSSWSGFLGDFVRVCILTMFFQKFLLSFHPDLVSSRVFDQLLFESQF